MGGSVAMTGSEADADPEARPTLRLAATSESSPDPDLDESAELDELEEFDLDEDALELILTGNPEQDLDFLLVPLLTEAERQMRSIRRPLDAEMWASELLGMLELGAPDDSTAEEREAVTLNLATRLTEYAVDQQSPSGLAILRTLSVIGPPESRRPAREAATRLASTGLRDRAWIAALGRPEVGRCWRFRDPDGSQESVTVVFGYGKREHTLTVLVDHVLGGGVKDSWIGEDPDGVLAETREALKDDGIEVEFISIDQATQTLREALTRAECPETEDEVEDVAMTRALLQIRVDLLVNGPTTNLRSTPGTLEG
jgi:hypothetical protein